FSPLTPTTVFYPLSLHDALPISTLILEVTPKVCNRSWTFFRNSRLTHATCKDSLAPFLATVPSASRYPANHCKRLSMEYLSKGTDRKSTRLNSSHVSISYAVFCL